MPKKVEFNAIDRKHIEKSNREGGQILGEIGSLSMAVGDLHGTVKSGFIDISRRFDEVHDRFEALPCPQRAKRYDAIEQKLATITAQAKVWTQIKYILITAGVGIAASLIIYGMTGR